MSDTTTTTATIDQLYVGFQPTDKQTGVVTIPVSKTYTRGSSIGLIKYGAVTAVADAGNTGDGTCTALATVLGSIKPIVGAYVLTCIEAVTHGGVFKLVDPNGSQVDGALAMTAATGGTTVLEAGGITFTLTDGATDFAAADFFTLTVAAGSGEGILVDKTAVDGSNELYGILSEAVTTGAGATQVAPVDLNGRFNTAQVVFESGTTYADVAEDARLKNIYFGTANY